MTFICPDCFHDSGLKETVVELRRCHYERRHCSFHRRKKGIPLDDVVETIDSVFRTHYEHAEYEYGNVQSGDDLTFSIQDLTGCIDELTPHLINSLIDGETHYPGDGDIQFYDTEQNFRRIGKFTPYTSIYWREFCQHITHQQRFFSSDAKEILSDILHDIHEHKNDKNRKPVYCIQPNTRKSKFFRARISSTLENCKQILEEPESQLGPPPKNLAQAGRMNPAGVRCFYGAYEVETCISELRPTVGEFVAYAEFTLARPIYVLDTTRFNEPNDHGSLFDPTYVDRVNRTEFLKDFQQQISQPVLPGDEHLDYIPTQAIAEYIAFHYKPEIGRKEVQIEAIIYPSPQRPSGKNIVLLGSAANILLSTQNSKPSQRNSHSQHDGQLSLRSIIDHVFEPEPIRPNPAIKFRKNSAQIKKITGVETLSESVSAPFPFPESFNDF